MYKRLLIPTDGSELSKDAVSAAIVFAKNIGAAVVGVHVIPAPRDDVLEAWMHHDPHFARQRQALFERMADECLSFVSNCALAQEVPCTCKIAESDEPHAAIVKTAEQSRCDLIYMASHGWKGEAPFLGSETLKVLHQSKIPVLVHKPAVHRH